MSEPESSRPSSVSAPSRGRWALVRDALSGEVHDVARGDLRRAIPLLAIPMVLEMAMEAIFALADVYFVGKVGPDAVTTVGLTESLMTIVYALAFGLAMPVTAMVARRVGEGDAEGASRAGAQAIWIGVAVAIAIGIPGVVFAPDLLRAMGAEGPVVATGTTFTRIMMATNVVILLLFLNNATLRGAGDASRSMRALWLANGINLVLDPVLIFGVGPFPELGVTGAAVATSIGRGTGVVYQLWHLQRGPRIVLRGRWGLDLGVVRTLLGLSTGGIAQQLIATASWVGLVRIVAGFGTLAVAGYTVMVRIVIFTILPSWGFANATATLVGQSLGAGDPDRAERAVWISGLYNMAFLSSLTVVFLLVPDVVSGLMTDDPAVADIATAGLAIIGLGYPFYAWEMVSIQAFNGAGDTRTPTWINLVAFWVVQLPLAWWLAHPLGLGTHGVFISMAFSYSFAAVLGVVWFRRGRWKQTRV